jgi:hypothetical protein
MDFKASSMNQANFQVSEDPSIPMPYTNINHNNFSNHKN